MADATTGGLPAKKLNSLPSVADVYDELLMPGEFQGQAVHVSAKHVKEYAAAGAKRYADQAKESAEKAKKSEENAEESAGRAKESEKNAAESAAAANKAKEYTEGLTVTSKTLAPGSAATVKKTTTSTSYNLEFGIPQGEKGEKGEKGDKGDKGDTGSVGPQGEPGKDATFFQAEGLYAFDVNQQGNLIVGYTGNTAPPFSLGGDGHLYYDIPPRLDLGKVAGENGRDATNENILDNWYFVNPINQRGDTSWTMDYRTYFIDRWVASVRTGGVSSGTLALTASGLKITNGCDVIYQRVERSRISSTAAYLTASILYTGTTSGKDIAFGFENDRWLQAANVKSVVGTELITVTMPVTTLGSADKFNVWLYATSGNNMTLIAAKLEEGDTQTLAHQENGKWVLNDPPPNPATELLKCQRYYWKSDRAFGFKNEAVLWENGFALCNVPFPVTMRAKPNVLIVSMKGTEGKLSTWAMQDETAVGAEANGPESEGFGTLKLSNYTPSWDGAYIFKVIASAEEL